MGFLFAIPYIVTAVSMVLLARHSDRTRERKGHVAFALASSGVFLLASVLLAREHFWLSFICLCLAAPGPYPWPASLRSNTARASG